MEWTRSNTVATPQFSMGSVLSRSFFTLMKNPVVFFGLTLATVVALFLIVALGEKVPAVAGLLGFANLALMLALQGATAYAVYQVLRGGKASIFSAISRGMARAGVLLVAAILMWLGLSLGLAFFILPGIILFCLWSVTIPACVVEKLGPLASMRRSRELTKGHRLAIFGLLLILLFIFIAIILGLGLIMHLQPDSGPSAFSFILPIAFLFLHSFANVMISIIYYDLRSVKDGVSLDKLANVFD